MASSESTPFGGGSPKRRSIPMIRAEKFNAAGSTPILRGETRHLGRIDGFRAMPAFAPDRYLHLDHDDGRTG